MRIDSDGHVTSVLVELDRSHDGRIPPESRQRATVRLRGPDGEVLSSWRVTGIDSTYEWVTGVLTRRPRSEFTVRERIIVIETGESQSVLAIYEPRLQEELALEELFTLDPDLVLTIVQEQRSASSPPDAAGR